MLKICLVLTPTIKSSYVSLKTYPVNNDKIDNMASSFVYKANTNYQPCPCDRNIGSCDAFCCCDTDCAQTFKDSWQQNGFCTNQTQES